MSQLFSGKDKPSQVCKIGRTCDGFLPLRPICVAGDSKNADLRHFARVPATLYSGTCDTSPMISPAALMEAPDQPGTWHNS